LYGLADPRVVLGDVGPLVIAVAESGDPVATHIVTQAGDALAQAVVAVHRHLELPNPTPVALAGSMIVHGEPLQRALQHALMRHQLAVTLHVVHDPAEGAMRIAHQMACNSAEFRGEWK
jgi:N-acetylglucosamine kinase-like BadF-type ATPase